MSGHLLRSGSISGVGGAENRDIGTVFRQCVRDAKTDAAIAAGNGCDESGKVEG
jgi:hypothetical protein